MIKPYIQMEKQIQLAKRIQLENVPTIPWKNGGGFTRELLAWPSPDHWVLRLSVAAIDQSGPFSVYKDVRRWFGVLTGAGVHLSSGGQINTVTSHTPLFEFDGGAQYECDLIDGPTNDFNVMFKSDALRCLAQRVSGTYVTGSWARSLVAVYANVDQTIVRRARGGAQPVQLQQGDLYWQILDSGDAPWQITSEYAICVEASVE